jgi:AraC family transcriptional regulator
MLILGTAKYLGSNLACYDTNGIWVSLTRYTKDNLPNSLLHAHENHHLTLLLQGGTVEKRKNGEYERTAGDIVFFPAGEPHQNSKTPVGSKNINFEFEPAFFSRYGIAGPSIQETTFTKSHAKFSLLKAYNELRIGDAFSGDSINMLLLNLLFPSVKPGKKPIPAWATKIQELLHDRWNEQVTLQELSLAAGVHPITISKHFPLYFSCTLGEYMRALKTEKALPLIKSSSRSLVDIAYECGFADQSHFTRTFKQVTGFLPNDFRKL